MAQFARHRYDNLQDDNLQDVMVQFARHRYGNLQGNSLQDMHMNVVSKNIVHSINLDDIWIYDHKYENA